MNRFLSATEDLQDTLAGVESREHASRLTQKLYPLFYLPNEFGHNDPNHPFTRFAARHDREGNRLRLFQAVHDLIDEENDDLQTLVIMMFEMPGTEPYNKINAVLSRFLNYANQVRDESSDSDSDDSDSSSTS